LSGQDVEVRNFRTILSSRYVYIYHQSHQLFCHSSPICRPLTKVLRLQYPFMFGLISLLSSNSSTSHALRTATRSSLSTPEPHKEPTSNISIAPQGNPTLLLFLFTQLSTPFPPAFRHMPFSQVVATFLWIITHGKCYDVPEFGTRFPKSLLIIINYYNIILY
jgi:hypothetical protein